MVCSINSRDTVRHLQMNNLVKEKRKYCLLCCRRCVYFCVILPEIAFGNRKLFPPYRNRSCSNYIRSGNIRSARDYRASLSGTFPCARGLTTLGANVFSMGIVGPVVAYIVYKAGMKANINFFVVVFLATALGTGQPI